MKMIDFYEPNKSQEIIELYKKQFSTDVYDVLGAKLEFRDLTPELIFLLSHKCQLKWLRESVEEIDPQEDFHHEIFEVLTDSEYSQGFLELVQNPQVSFLNAVELTLDYYEAQLSFIESYHINKKTQNISPKYLANQDLGDFETKNEDETQLVIGGYPKKLEQTLIVLKDQSERASETQLRVNKTISRLKHLTPTCFERLETFTKYLVPTFSPGMVSFSSESLPFYSCINFNERDDVDLLDDLLHENGHHQLNLFLYNYELIDESDPNLYFSPWRETLRPLRGIYHGFCTFFWACDLFYHLLQSSKLDSEFSIQDIEKIKWRFHEESFLLKMAFPHIQKAHKRGFVSVQGMDIANKLLEKVDDYNKNCHIAELNSTNINKFQALTLELANKRQECEKSL